MLRSLLHLAVLLPALVLGLSAQITPCLPLGDDGLANGNCCGPAQAVVPNFGTINTSGVYGCIPNCNAAQQFPVRVRFDFQPVLCDIATIPTAIIPGVPGAPTMNGLLFAKYMRTFVEFEPTGLQVQIWRYVVNGDFTYSQFTPNNVPCPVPFTATNNRPIHFFGTIDFRCEPNAIGTQSFAVRYDLSHLPNCIANGPFTTRPIPAVAGAPSFSYHLVGPGPFNFVPHAAPVGFAPGESQRSSRVSWAPFAYQCQIEKQMQAQIGSVARSCACVPTTAANPIYEEMNFQGRVICNGVVTPYASVPNPFLGAGGVLALKLGNYATTGTEVTVYLGLFQYTDFCNQEGPLHIVAGSATKTQGAYRFFNTPAPAGALLNTAIDMANSLVLDFFPPAVGWGSPFVSTQAFSWSL